MRPVRWLRLAAVAMLATAGGAVTAATPVHASPSCSHYIDWYHNNYEVVASNRISCNMGMYEVWARVALTAPTYVPNDNLCMPARNCSATTYTNNRAGTQTYCAEAWGLWRWDYRDTFGTELKRISSCISA